MLKNKRLRFKFKGPDLDKYQKLLIFFAFILFVLWIRLFYLQVIQHKDYYSLLISQHYSISSLEPDRGNIYIEDQNGEYISLTENINLYELYVDPYVVRDPNKLSNLLAPILYNHFCDRYKLDKLDKLTCIKNVEKFSGKKLLKDYEDKNKSLLSGELVNTQLEKKEEDLSYVSTGDIQNTIKDRLYTILKKSYITKPYIGFIQDSQTLEKLKKLNIPGIELNGNYLYVDLKKVNDKDKVINSLYKILHPIDSKFTINFLEKILRERPKRYVKISSYINPKRINEIKKLKKKYENDKKDKIPLFHGIGFKKQAFRFYPNGDFLSHVIGYVNNNHGILGIEGYFDDILRGKEGKIVGMNTPWIGNIGSSSYSIQQPENGANIYLTIDYNLQKASERILMKYYYALKADNVSIVIMDPYNGQIKAMASYPNFDPNNWKDIYKIKPLTDEYKYLVDPEEGKTYIDIPILINTGGKLKLATSTERFDPKYKKYIFKNLFGPRTFINQNISDSYEPGSVFKVITEAIGIDTKDIKLYGRYRDKGEIKVGPYTIKNVAKECLGYHTYLHALERSCNVGMVNIVNKIGKYVFYNYLQQLGFGEKTGIQLANEDAGKIGALEHFSKARFYNNSFGQGILVTPLQMAVSYAAIVNGGYLLKPTIVKKIEKDSGTINYGKFIKDKVFATRVAKDIIYALYSTIYNGDLIDLAIPRYTIGGKTGTSQIAYKGRYKKGTGWTIGSFVGIVTKNNLKYVIAVKVSRPRTCQWGLCTAGNIFKDVAQFIIKYKGIKK